MSKNNMVVKATETKKNTVEISLNEIIALYTEANAQNIITTRGNAFLANLGETLTLKLVSYDEIIKDTYDTDVSKMDLNEKLTHLKTINRSLQYNFTDETNKLYEMELFYFYWDKATNKKFNLKDMQIRLTKSILAACKVENIDSAINKELLITPEQRISNSGKSYITYDIKAAE